MLPLKVLGKNLPLPLPAFSDSGLSLACVCVTPISASVFTWTSPCVSVFSSLLSLIRMLVIGLKPTLIIQDDLKILNYVCKDPFFK